MAWIESHQELGRHPKTRKLARSLGISRVQAVGHLHFLWWWCLDYAQDGDLSGFTADEISEAADWEGESELFWAALFDAGFVTDESTLHDWNDYAGKLIDQRKANAEKQRRWRERHKADPEMGHTDSVTVTSPLPSPLRNGATVPNRTVPNRTVPNRREASSVVREGVQGEDKPSRGKRATTPAPDDFPITDDLRAWAAEKAPGVDLDAETTRFLDRARAKDERFADWRAAWRNWMTSPYAKARGPGRNGAEPDAIEATFGKKVAPTIKMLREWEAKR